MKEETIKYQDAWNAGFDYFFERRKEFYTLPPTLQWSRGFIAASNYCEHLLKEAKKKSDI
jgi:hypothetical protein